MTWLFTALKALGALTGLSDLITGWFHDRTVKQQQKDADYAEQTRRGIREIDQAQQARQDAASAVARDPSSVRGADPDARGYDPNEVG